MKRWVLIAGTMLLLLVALAGGWLLSWPGGLRALTGEEPRAAQIRGLGHWLSGRLRPYPAATPLEPVRHAGLYPFGLNTFLQNETEPEKVERSLDLIAEGGFRWIRQEFPWEDLEIHHDGWYVDLRNGEIRSSWAKYDRIVALAEARGINIIVRLSNPPLWSRSGESGDKAPPDQLEAYGDYVAAVVGRYRGRISHFQIWNEPNCCEEWGRSHVSPEAYVDLLRVAYTRAKAANPRAVILTAPLAPTIVVAPQAYGAGPPALNDFLFLERMYAAGAAPYFDVLAVQDYGLWSGAYDRRMRPRVANYSRPEYIRDLMRRNGDGDKAIWASEIGWNATPPGTGIPPVFGATPEEWRGTYLVEALERQQREWPWMGVTTIWFFKPTSDEERDQPQYYFRLLDPDFTPLPAWETLTSYIQNLSPTLYRGYHQENHWVVLEATSNRPGWTWSEGDAPLAGHLSGTEGAEFEVAVEGERLTLVGVTGQPEGEIRLHIAGRPVEIESGAVDHRFSVPLPAGRVMVTVEVASGTFHLDAIIVE